MLKKPKTWVLFPPPLAYPAIKIELWKKMLTYTVRAREAWEGQRAALSAAFMDKVEALSLSDGLRNMAQRRSWAQVLLGACVRSNIADLL